MYIKENFIVIVTLFVGVVVRLLLLLFVCFTKKILTGQKRKRKKERKKNRKKQPLWKMSQLQFTVYLFKQEFIQIKINDTMQCL